MRDSVNLKLPELVKDLIELTVQRREALLFFVGFSLLFVGMNEFRDFEVGFFYGGSLNFYIIFLIKI